MDFSAAGCADAIAAGGNQYDCTGFPLFRKHERFHTSSRRIAYVARLEITHLPHHLMGNAFAPGRNGPMPTFCNELRSYRHEHRQ
jgi:hypothetical protein